MRLFQRSNGKRKDLITKQIKRYLIPKHILNYHFRKKFHQKPESLKLTIYETSKSSERYSSLLELNPPRKHERKDEFELTNEANHSFTELNSRDPLQ